MRRGTLSAALLWLAAGGPPGIAAPPSALLPYDRTNPVMYDNDYANDYIDWYLMALASAGDIDYRGVSTSSSVAPYNQHMTDAELDHHLAWRIRIVEDGRAGGLRNVPDPLPGTRGHLVKPASGRIEDTAPLGSPGSRRILEEARKATAAKPLVVCVGGPATAVADAYIQDPSIADKVVVGFVDRNTALSGFNGWSDGWAAYIALERLRLVVFPIQSQLPRLSKQWIRDNLPDGPVKTHMLSLPMDVVNGEDGDADGMPAAAIMRPDYVHSAKRVSFGGWTDSYGHEVPVLQDDPGGRAIAVTGLDGAIASAEYRRAFTNPAAWHAPTPLAPGAGSGLEAQYFANPTLSGAPALTRRDGAIDFDWGTGAPDPALPADGFSVRWSGRVAPAHSEVYTFHATSDDGVRLWVDGRLLVDAWLDQAATERSQSIALTAGQAVDVVMEYYENGGDALARLAWSSASTPKGAVPVHRLTPPTSSAGTGTPSAPAGRGDSSNGDHSLNDRLCGALGLEALAVLALALLRRRSLRWAPAALVLTFAAPASAQTVPLPYDASNPVLYDNDAVWESGWTDPYIFALASAGTIDLRGVVTTGVWPYAPGPSESWGKERQPLIHKARRSGMRNLPDVVDSRNVTISSRRPASRRIEDTPAIHSDGGKKIVAEARKCSAQKPLVVVVGGLATSVADAYLIDPTIADKVVIAWLAGSPPRADGTVFFGWYNATEDAWAAFIVLERFRTVIIPEPYNNTAAPLIPRERLYELPDTELRQVMLESWHPARPTDADGPPVVTLTRPSYILESKRYAFSHFEPAVSWGWNGMNIPTDMPVYRPDAAGRVIVVTRADQSAATAEWWTRVKNPAAWAGPRIEQAPHGGAPRAIPGTVEAEHFDEGGNGRAYQDSVEPGNYDTLFWQDAPRFMESVDTIADASASGGAKIGSAKAGEWLEYGVQVAATGTYDLSVRVASAGGGGTFRLEVDGVDRTGALTVPNTGGWSAWQTVVRSGLPLSAGLRVLRLSMLTNGATGAVGDFDRLSLAAAGAPPSSGGSGSGLSGEYFDNLDFTALRAQRTEAVNFDWGANAPAAGMGADTFSVRWTGRVEAPVAGAYTFFTLSDDGVRLWIDGRLIIDNWTNHPPTENASSLSLSAGLHDIRIEYFENGGEAVMKLLWSGPGLSKQAVPQDRLHPAAGGGTNGSGTGLSGEYFDNPDFTVSRAVRTEAVNFDWGSAAPLAGMGADTFSVRWTGRVEVPTSGAYTFFTVSDDGVRLWVAGRLLVDNWTNHPPTENAGSLSLSAGLHDIRIDYYENFGGATARLLWSGPAISKQAVPASRLFPAGGAVQGLRAEIYDNMDLTSLKASRTDAAVDFDWGLASPDPAVGADTFSIRWTGQIEVPTSGAYTFYTFSDDGVRLWMDGQLLVNNWTNHPPTENAGTISLGAGRRAIRIEFFENGGEAVMKLLWSGPGFSKQTVPSARLIP